MITVQAVAANQLGLYARVARVIREPGRHIAEEPGYWLIGRRRPITAYQPRHYASEESAHV